MDNGTVVLQAVLTAGNGKNTYQWQSSADGETWTDIAGAADARFAPETDETGKTLYRCVVQNAGAVIYTAHGGRVPTYAETTLEPAAVTVRMAETALSAGELTLVLGGREMGEFTFAPFKGGWSIQNENGKYLTASGRLIFWSSEPMAWRLENGALTTTATLAVTGLGKLLTLGYLRDVSLTVSGGKLAVTTGSGATATFRAPVAD